MSSSTDDDAAFRRTRRLDMSHGFIKSIVKNQIDRDEYNKVMEQRNRSVRQKMASSQKNKVENSNLYIPPHARRKMQDAQASSSYETSKVPPVKRPSSSSLVVTANEETTLREKVRNRTMKKMSDVDDLCISLKNSNMGVRLRDQREIYTVFKLTLKKGEDEDVQVDVKNTDNAARLAKTLAMEHSFSDVECRRIRNFIDQQLIERIASDGHFEERQDEGTPIEVVE